MTTERVMVVQKPAGPVRSDGKQNVPERTKGMLSFWMEGSELMMGWKALYTEEEEASVALRSGEASFQKLESAPRRIMLAEIQRPSRDPERHLFWMQDEEEDEDEDFVSLVNLLISESACAGPGFCCRLLLYP
eukprot:TRINITY_DN11157_c0_g1_i1.p2 TRINITY_DN11157_c0_g1~~TRINITY_DN11157_c0_g1_i1.p2  ORF type:complete len:133 (+),score=29.66 TRINITY_DN11157_c0_g1_i1:212-610(+)